MPFVIDDFLIGLAASAASSAISSALSPKQTKSVGQAQGSSGTGVQPTQFTIPQVSSQDIAQLMQMLGQTRQPLNVPLGGQSQKTPARSFF